MKKVFSVLKNKYLITIVALLTWLMFFDKNDFSTQLELSNKVKKLQTEREYYIKAIEDNKREIKELQTDSNNLEKFARENYLFKRDNEDVFVIVNK
ncbi:MAG TPA: septum formation initiator family protein [Bacteroidia bacterium]